ncbi:hypothetical protein FSP39_005492 [Pinctada imbricata]|uniref:Metalloreductase STEAP2 n=1 Tax=Pinctada imbricata TaxID=66713 RepID=A0AA89C0K9_PINIB|nr:hypothetical protein FSP39_005492 [Pinctada imbricata]
MVKERTIGIIGTGDFAQGLARRLVRSGYDVIVGSRRPERREITVVGQCLCSVKITSIEECVQTASVILLAVHVENYKDCIGDYVPLFSGKTVVDVSNRARKSKKTSNAEYLSTLLPESIIVKAFNVISAYAMENDSAGGSKQVYVASNDIVARDKICSIARDMGFVAVDLGVLAASKQIESFPLTLFPNWRGPIAFTVATFNVWLLYIMFIYFVQRSPAAYRWDQLFVKVLNKPLCMTAITVLACTYLPSSVAAIFQMYYGTKHIRFPEWLDRWLKCRKQLGLIAFILVFIHVIFSVVIMSPTYFRSWYQSTTITIPGNLTEDIKIPIKTWMIWKGEAAILVGTIAFLCLCIIAVSTLPSVTNTLNWREWRCVQSKLGHVTLFLCVLHAAIMGIPGWIKYNPAKLFQSITFLSSLLPYITLLLKIILSFPCFNRYVKKIRRGWEASYSRCRAECSTKHSSPGYIVMQKNGHVVKDLMGDEREAMIGERLSGCQCDNASIV